MIEKKIEAILKELTLEEKIGMIHGSGLFRTAGVERLCIKPLYFSDGPMGVREEFQNDKWIPLNRGDDRGTYLPGGSAIACTWNPSLAHKYGQILGREARARGKDVILAPSINIIRSPLCGRNFEYLSEDPQLAGSLAAEMVKGIQESDVAACAKHFVANNQETNRLHVDAIVSEKTLHEIYFKAFRDVATKAGILAVMTAYNKLNGEYCSHGKWLLNEILRKEWGFKYLTVSDWGAVHDSKEAAEAALDVEMSVTSGFENYHFAMPLLEKIKKGEISETHIDEKVRNILRTMFAIKKLGDTENRKKGAYNDREHRAGAYEIALESIVLLKNEGVLPLSKNLKKLLVIGDNATRLHAHKGGSAEIKALYEIPPLLGIRNRLGDLEIRYARGYYVPEKETSARHWQELSLEERTEMENRLNEEIKAKQREYLEEAVALAKDYEHVLVFAGLNREHDVEGADRKDMRLPYGQDELISEVLKANPNAVIHILSGSAVDMSAWHGRAKAILWSGYLGMETGNALADVIFGNASPSGKLAQTFAHALEDYSSHAIGEFPGGKRVLYREEELVGYRHFLKNKVKPLFSFGHGLSYSEFSFSGFTHEKEGNLFRFRFNIKNIGSFDAAETVQVYVQSEEGEPRVLKAYKKIFLKRGEEKQASIILDEDAFSRYDEEAKRFAVKKGQYRIFIGTSVENIIYRTEIEV